MKTVLFACVHNAGRSQLAQALFNRLADPTQARAISAGTDPAPRIHPEVQAALAEIGIDAGAQRPRKLTPELARVADLLVTMGCGEACPEVPGLQRLDWRIEDPKGLSLERVRAIRADLEARVCGLLRDRGWAR